MSAIMVRKVATAGGVEGSCKWKRPHRCIQEMFYFLTWMGSHWCSFYNPLSNTFVSYEFPYVIIFHILNKFVLLGPSISEFLKYHLQSLMPSLP